MCKATLSLLTHLARFVSLLFAVGIMPGCGGGAREQAVAEPEPQPFVLSGALTFGVAGATVNAYALNTDGSNGALLGSATSNADGSFEIALAQPPTGGVRITAAGGSYSRAADNTRTLQGVAWSAVLPQVAGGGESGLVLSPLSAFVDRRFLRLLASALAPAAALEQSDAFVRGVYGLQGAGVPIHRLRPDFRAASGVAAAFAFALGGLDQLALIVARSPLDIWRAIGEDIADGTLDGRTVGGAAIHYDAATAAPATLAGGSFLSALDAYLVPSNTQTLLFRNSVTPDPAAVHSLTVAVATSIRPPTGAYGNNGAVLEGARVGSGVAGDAELRKPIKATYTGSLPLAFGTAMASRPSRSSDAMYIAVPVTNTGNVMLCFVQLNGLTYRDAAGNALAASDIAYVYGSIGIVGIGRTSTHTCLEAGATGFVLDISTSIRWGAVSQMEFGAEATNLSSSVSLGSLIPQSYQVAAASSWQSLEITVVNVGTGPAKRTGSTFSTWILLDGTSQALMWGFATDGPSNALIPVGGTTTVTDATLIYEGTGTRILAQLDFDDAVTAMAAQAVSDTCAVTTVAGPSFDACMHTAQMQAAKAAQRTVERIASR